MATSDFTGPLIVFGQAALGTDNNLNRGPSLFYAGSGIMDLRTPYAYDPDKPGLTYGWPGVTRIPVVDAVPATITGAANRLATTQTPTAGTALVLVTATGTGVTAGATIYNATNGNLVKNLLAIDGPVVPAGFGPMPKVAYWDPGTAVARNVTITSVGVDTSATFVVRGYDQYFYPMSETITGAGAGGTAAGKKAFKYVASVTPAGTLSGSAVTVGVGDVYGLPLRVDTWGYVEIYWNGALITSSTGFTASLGTGPATATNADVRGTYAVQSASDGTKRLQIFVTPSVANVGSASGLTGVTQFSS